MTETPKPNPYPGPRPFRAGEKLYGRDWEITQLFYLLSAERIVILHSPSGAGKSSLLHAGLVPKLQGEGFDVWPSIRVSAPVAGPGNRFVKSVVASLEEGLPAERRRPGDEIAGQTLAQYVAQRPRGPGAPSPVVLVFDQFEEILTLDPLDVEAKREFFRQLGDTLKNPDLWALFALREDYLAALDPYRDDVPTRLSNTFRIDMLSIEAGLKAITEPPKDAGREFADEAARKLVEDLATVSVQQPDSSFRQVAGRYVEPVQLQVVCRRLWDELPADIHTIGVEHLQASGDVDAALATYYDRCVADIARGDAPYERRLREWFSERLVTPSGIRGQVLSGVGNSGGLDNDSVRLLLDTHLVRSEQRVGAIWYELAHDRLVVPVRTSNAAWFEKNLHPMQRQAALWEREGKPDRLLLRAGDLADAEDWASANAASVLPIEHDLLNRSVGQRRATWIKQGTGVLIIIILMGTGAILWYQQRAIAEERRLNIHVLEAKVDSLEQAKGQSGAARQQELAQVQMLRATNAGLKDKVATLDGERTRLDAALVALREGNRQLEARLDVYAVEQRLLEQRSKMLDQDSARLTREQRDIRERIASLKSVPPTLAVHTQALRQKVAALSSRHAELTRLVEQTESCVRPVSRPEPRFVAAAPAGKPASAPELQVAPPPDIPPDPGGSDVLRRRIDALQHQLAALIDERARLQEEATWLQKANQWLEEQRAALDQEIARLRDVQRVLQRREQALRVRVELAEEERNLLQDQIATEEKRNAELRAAVDALREEHRQLERQAINESKEIGLLYDRADQLSAENRNLVKRITPVVDRILQAAAGSQQGADLAAMLAVKAYRWAPYDTDDAAQPAVYNGLWLALRRVNRDAALALLAPGDPAAGKLATTRSEVLVEALCQRAARPFTKDEWRRFMPNDACFTSEAARACGP